MIKFFRKTRQKLLAEKKVGRYLAYAIGEIVLVVIGILIALAINNANQRNIDSKNEKTYLMGLREEFNTSKVKLMELMSVNNSNIEGARKLLALTNLQDSVPSENELSKLLFNTFVSDIAFNPNNSLLNEIINSGNLKNISNPDLRIRLTNWIATLEDISRQERDLGLEREGVLNMFKTDNYNMKTIFKHAGIYNQIHLPDEGLETPGNLHLLKSREFENKLLTFTMTSYATQEAHYEPLMVYLDLILDNINQELQNH